MADSKIIDVHSHFFNGKYALEEFTAASWEMLKGEYPHGYAKRKEIKQGGYLYTLEGAAAFAAWAARLLDAALSDCQGNYKNETDSFKESRLSCEGSLLTVPLMMDIYYALDDNGSESAKEIKTALRSFTVDEDETESFENHLSNVKDLITVELHKLSVKAKAADQSSYSEKKLDDDFKEVRDTLLGASATVKSSVKYEGIEMSPGYKKHMEALENMAGIYPKKVIPFLAADPRRAGIMKLIEMKTDKGRGVFKGIKLYPPLGYLPTYPKLEEIYDYCSVYDIPVTVHCSEGGMENFRTKNWILSWEAEPHLEDFSKSGRSKSNYYANPENWIPVLQRWPNLRINFGHFGGNDKDNAGSVHMKWAETITEMMILYPNVYADLSFLANRERKAATLNMINKNEILRERLMFGTDYVMLALNTEPGGLKQYFNGFSGLDGRLLYDNARNFLKI